MKKKYRKAVEKQFSALGFTIDERKDGGKHVKYYLTGPAGEKVVQTVSCTPKNEGNTVKAVFRSARKALALAKG